MSGNRFVVGEPSPYPLPEGEGIKDGSQRRLANNPCLDSLSQSVRLRDPRKRCLQGYLGTISDAERNRSAHIQVVTAHQRDRPYSFLVQRWMISAVSGISKGTIC